MNKLFVWTTLLTLLCIASFFVDYMAASIAFPAVLITVFSVITILGDVLPLAATLFIVILGRASRVLSLWIATGATVLVTFGMKQLVARQRPDHGVLVSLFGDLGFSFPSMHSAIAFALVPFFPETKPVMFVVAGLIAISRVVLGVHFLSDVLFGALIGYLIGSFVKTWCSQ